MAAVLHRATKRFLRSANTPDYPAGEWIINPDLSAVDGFHHKYWVISGDVVSLMPQAERDAVDAAEAQASIDSNRAEQKDKLDKERLLKGIVLWARDELNELRVLNSLPGLTAAEIRAEIKAYVDQV